MKANKVTVKITVEALSIECLHTLLAKVIEQVREEYENGKLTADDGDTVEWETTREAVEF